MPEDWKAQERENESLLSRWVTLSPSQATSEAETPLPFLILEGSRRYTTEIQPNLLRINLLFALWAL